MKKHTITILVVIGLFCCLGGAIASTAGSKDDPVISLSYITNTYLPGLLSSIESKITSAGDVAYGKSHASLSTKATEYGKQIDAISSKTAFAPEFIQARVKNNDTLTGTTGTGFLLLAGSVTVTFSSGTVINVSAGTETPSGSSLAASERYLVAEDTTAVFTVTSDTAVIEYEGNYSFLASDATDYNSMADAMRTMSLFKGGDVGYGSGYMLEKKPSRIEGLIMFIRLLGEEDEALSYGGSHPFKDVPAWCSPYVAYAYYKGYSNGTSSSLSLFGTYKVMTAPEYMTLLLRSMGYSDSAGDFTWDTSLARAKDFGLITAGEYTLLSEKDFYRAQVVYLSYYSLGSAVKGSTTTLLQKLIAAGAVDQQTAAGAMSKVIGLRIQ